MTTMTCEQHKSDRVPTEIRIDPHGFEHVITHCKHCGIEMSIPRSAWKGHLRFKGKRLFQKLVNGGSTWQRSHV